MVRKQQVAENFTGDSLDERWFLENVIGTGSAVIQDAIDGGMRLSTGANSSDRSDLNFNDIRQFDNDAVRVLFVFKLNQTTNYLFIMGLYDDDSIQERIAIRGDDDVNTNFGLNTEGSDSNTTIYGSVTVDTNWHSVFLHHPTSIFTKMYIDGILDVLKTTDQPDLKLQPLIFMQSDTSGAKSVDVRYYEAINL